MTIPTPTDSPLRTDLAIPAGFRAGGVCAGIKSSGALDLGMIVCDTPAVSAAITTRNRFCGAPVTVVRERLAASNLARGAIVNSGMANVCTGDRGLADARAMARLAETACGAPDGSFLVASTGRIGEPLPMDKIAAAVPTLAASLSAEASGWHAFARAIMTTDTRPKIASRRIDVRDPKGGRRHAHVLGIAKGSGMIEPDMATMLAFVTTDYALRPEEEHLLLPEIAGETFNCLTVDGDTSTSDMLILMTSGAAVSVGEGDARDDRTFVEALADVCGELTRMIARDGEGANHLVTIEVRGTADNLSARRIAKTIANSPLVKTAIFGRDPNWGRICAAAGRAGVAFDPARVDLRLQGARLMIDGAPVAHDRAALSQALSQEEVRIDLTVGPGPGRARVWTCDLSYDYVKINAEYTT